MMMCGGLCVTVLVTVWTCLSVRVLAGDRALKLGRDLKGIISKGVSLRN